jgi:Uma2 family endonuclease
MSSPGDHVKGRLPAIDERLVAPESGYEVDDGKLVFVPPSLPPHAIRHSKVAAMLEAHAAGDYEVAVDMLIRTSELNDRAPDVSVFPRGTDPVTGGRRIEELAFEIMSTESRGYAAKKARDLANRGVRRVFAIDVGHARAFEWSRELDDWTLLHPQALIDDPALAVSLPIDALVRAIDADDAVARALRAKRHREFLLERAEGRAEGLASAVLAVLVARGLNPTDEERQQIESERDPNRLERWLVAATTCNTVRDVLR